MVINHTLFADLFAIDAHIVATGKVLHHAILFRVVYMMLAVVRQKVPLRLGTYRAARTLKISFFAVSVLHVLEEVAATAVSYVAFSTPEPLLRVFVNVVHAHCRRLLVVAVVAALWTVDMTAYLLISINILGVARLRVRRLYCLHD